jgi:glycosyltransferase involved in cell wall biosynthesis
VAGVWGRLAALKFRKPKLVHTLHGIHYLNFPGSLKFLLGVWSEKFLSSFTEMTICVSESDLKKGREHKLFKAKKSTVIRNGIEAVQAERMFDASRKSRELGLAEGDFVVGSIGRLDIAKGYTYLLAAASLLKERLPQARFVIAGDGPLKIFLQAQQSKLGLNGTVMFLGTRRDAPELLQIFDVLVLPSLWEGMPLVVLEGMQAGKAIVASDIDAVKELIDDQKEGVLFPARNHEALASAIESLAHDSRKRMQLGENARKKMSAEFSLPKMIENHENIYLSVAGN